MSASRIFPSFSCRVRAWTVPLLATTPAERASAALLVITTWPPSALIICLFSIRVFTVAGAGHLEKPLAPPSRVTLSPAARATLPRRALTMPSFFTVGASRATRPPSPRLEFALIEDGAGGAVAGEAQLAGKEVFVGDVQGGGDQAPHIHLGPGAEDDTVGVHQIDLSIGRELALDLAGLAGKHPVEGDAGGGGRKRTAAWLPMSKRCQLRMALSLPWVMVSWLPFWARAAWPATTCPPVGRALAAGGAARAEPASRLPTTRAKELEATPAPGGSPPFALTPGTFRRGYVALALFVPGESVGVVHGGLGAEKVAWGAWEGCCGRV